MIEIKVVLLLLNNYLKSPTNKFLSYGLAAYAWVTETADSALCGNPMVKRI